MPAVTAAGLRGLRAIRQQRVFLYAGANHFRTLAPPGSRIRTDVIERLIREGLAKVNTAEPFPREVTLTEKGSRALDLEGLQ